MRERANGSIPMVGSILLDTNVVIPIFKQDAEVLAKLALAEDVALSIVVLGELYFVLLSPRKLMKTLTGFTI